MEEYVKLFCDARNYLIDNLEPKIETFLCGIWDPHCNFLIMKETQNIIQREYMMNETE